MAAASQEDCESARSCWMCTWARATESPGSPTVDATQEMGMVWSIHWQRQPLKYSNTVSNHFNFTKVETIFSSNHFPTVFQPFSWVFCINEDLAAWEPFWLPARASRGEWLGIDLDAGAEWQPAAWLSCFHDKTHQLHGLKLLPRWDLICRIFQLLSIHDPSININIFITKASNIIDLFDLKLSSKFRCVSSHLPIVDFVGTFVGKWGNLQEFRGLPLGFDRGIAGWGRVGLWRKNAFFAGCCPVGCQGNLRFFHSFSRLLVIDSSFFEYLGK